MKRPSGYFPNTPNQFREPTVDDCTWYAMELAFERASETHLSMHPVKALRNHSSDTTGGTQIPVALRETLRLWPREQNVIGGYGLFTLPQIKEAANKGATIVTGGDYEKLPAHIRRWTNNDFFNHAMANWGNKRGKTWLYDPLGGGPTFKPYSGEWISWKALFNRTSGYNWSVGNRYYVAIIANSGRSREMINVHVPRNNPTTKELQIKRGRTIRKAPSPLAQKVQTVSNANKWWPFLGRSRNGYLVVLFPANQNSWELGYVHRSDIKAKRNTPIATQPVQEEVPNAEEVIITINDAIEHLDNAVWLLERATDTRPDSDQDAEAVTEEPPPPTDS